MEDFRNSLLQAKELVMRCKDREELKRYSAKLLLLGIIKATLRSSTTEKYFSRH